MGENSLANTQPPFDIYRSTSLRYLGYFGLFGRICTSIVPNTLAQMVATSYIVSDVADKVQTNFSPYEGKSQLFVNAGDAIIWQAASSIIIPGLLLKSFSEQAQKLKIKRKLAEFRLSALPCILGLALLPLLSYPIDRGVNFVMDNTYRKWFQDGTKLYDIVLTENTHTFSEKLPELKDFDEVYKEMKSRNASDQCKSNKNNDSKSSPKQQKQQDKPQDKNSAKQPEKQPEKKSKRICC